MSILYVIIVVSAWSSNPMLRRAFVDRVGDAADGKMTFVLWNSVVCSVIAAVSVWFNKTKVAPINDAPLLGMVIGTATMGVLSNYLMNVMMSTDNPGKIVCVVGGVNNIVVYVIGSLMYGQLNARGVLGAVLCSMGIALITEAKAQSVAVMPK